MKMGIANWNLTCGAFNIIINRSVIKCNAGQRHRQEMRCVAAHSNLLLIAIRNES
jgi:hypothetical protein